MIHAIFQKKPPQTQLSTEGTDLDFDAIYPPRVRRLAEQHFTPLAVARKAANFLVTRPDVSVLDIGSGAGKFCLIGAATTRGNFTGIEQREDLVSLSRRIAGRCGLQNAKFIHSNVLATDLEAFDAFYLFNPFQENIDAEKRMDDAVLLNASLYKSYSSYTRAQLARKTAGTRLATYYTAVHLLPTGYELVESLFDGKLMLWQKH